MTNGVFSEYDLREQGIKTVGSEAFKTASCVGSCEEELDVKVTKKKCRGVVIKTRVRGAGTGKLKVSMHMPWDIYTDVYGMDLEDLIEGVKAYGTNSVHKEFAITQHVFDEDDAEKYKAYPKCIIETGVVRKVENGAEEVAEIEMEISLMPDDHGNCLYEALAEELQDEEVKTKWMTEFEPSLVHVAEA